MRFPYGPPYEAPYDGRGTLRLLGGAIGRVLLVRPGGSGLRRAALSEALLVPGTA